MTSYRVSTVGRASALSGNATLALVNKAASGRRVAIKNIEVHPLTTYTTTRDRIIRMGRSTTFSNGRTVTPAPRDTTSAAADLTVGLAGSVAVLDSVIRTFNFANRDGPSFALGHLVKNGATGRIGASQRSAGTWRGESSARERLIISPGETVAAVMHLTHEPLFGYVTAEFRNTTTGKHYQIMEWTYALTESQALFTVTNTDATEDYEIVTFDFQVVGTVTATPYYRIVPFAAIDTDHIAESRLDAIGDFLKLDTADPDPSTYMTAVFDCSVSPLGVPISYLAEGSAGVPKGFNYLQTKDFDGPVYATLFPERAMTRYAATVPDGFLFFGQNRVKRKNRVTDSSIIIRPGEGIAIVGSAETATGATAVEVNGWNICEIIMDIEVLPLYAPQLTLTGLQANTEVRIFNAGTTTELAGQEDIDSGTFSWSYDYETYTSVDISILSLGYQNIRLLGLPITFAGLTVPIQQLVDRQYENP